MLEIPVWVDSAETDVPTDDEPSASNGADPMLQAVQLQVAELTGIFETLDQGNQSPATDEGTQRLSNEAGQYSQNEECGDEISRG